MELCEGLITLWYFYGVIRSSKHDTSLFRLQLFQTKDIAGAALKQQYYHLAIIAGAAHACMRSMHMYSVSACMERKNGSALHSVQSLASLAIGTAWAEKEKHCSAAPSVHFFHGFQLTATGPYSQVGSVHRPCKSPETDRPGNA